MDNVENILNEDVASPPFGCFVTNREVDWTKAPYIGAEYRCNLQHVDISLKQNMIIMIIIIKIVITIIMIIVIIISLIIIIQIKIIKIIITNTIIKIIAIITIIK